MIAAASLLQWAESAHLSSRTPEAIQDAFYDWYDSLSSADQENFAEAWTMIEPDALSLLSDKGEHDRPHHGRWPGPGHPARLHP